MTSNVVLKRKHLIKEGEVVCAYISRDNLQLVLITPGQYLNSKFGNFKHDSLIGLEYGSKVNSNLIPLKLSKIVIITRVA